jgi:hypothetical protein
MRFSYAFSLATLTALSSPARGEIDVTKSDRVLVRDTYKENFRHRTDWRLATLVDEKTYD